MTGRVQDSRRRRRSAVLAGLAVAAAALVGAVGPGAAMATSSAPRPGSPLPEGPWPPSRVLATSPERVAAPAAASSAVSTRECSTPPYGVNHYAPGTGKTVALTFDDGPGPTTMPILSILQAARVTATFFNLGLNSAVRPREVRAEATVGAALGNHTWDHPQLPTLSTSAQASEMDRASAEQAALVGRPPCLFRPPYGAYTSTTLALAQQRRMAVWNWSVDTEDWKAGSSTAASWVERIVSRAEAGGSQQHPVVLLHNPPAGLPATVTALPRIIDYYRARGYTFVDLLGGTGYGTPGPAVASTGGGVHVIVRGSDGGLYARTLRSGAWSGWSALGGALVGGPAAAAVGSGTTRVFGQGTDNGIWEMTVPDAGGASAWSRLGGIATSKPAAAAAPDGVLSVVIRGADAGGWLRQNPGGRWGAWQPLGGVLASAPAAAVTVDGGLTVVAVGTDKALWSRHRTATSWSTWRRVGGTVGADPGLSATAGGGSLVAVVRGADGAGWVNVADASATAWSGWRRIGGVLASPPAVAVDGATLRVTAYGTDGRVWEDVAAAGSTATGWSGWHPLPG